MDKYLETDKPTITDIVNTIVRDSVTFFKPKSIILMGSFGRNEISAMEENGNLTFFSDCDILIVHNTLIENLSMNDINHLSLILTKKTGVKIVISHSIILSMCTMLPILYKLLSKVWRPSISHYDLKNGSKVVYGENILTKIPSIESATIPLWEGIRLLFNRMIEALEYFPMNPHKRHETIISINKVVLACQDALLLSNQQYHHSYKIRNAMFQTIYPVLFSRLSNKAPELLELTIRATEYKLNPQKEDVYPRDLITYWFDIVEICDIVFRYVVEKDTGITFQNYIEFQSKYLKHENVRGPYYLGVFSVPIIQNIITASRMILYRSYRMPPFKLIRNYQIPWQHIIYSLIPLLFFSVTRYDEIFEDQLNSVRDLISLFKKLEPKKQYLYEEWAYIKDQSIILWSANCC
jgi:hypothetical protein